MAPETKVLLEHATPPLKLPMRFYAHFRYWKAPKGVRRDVARLLERDNEWGFHFDQALLGPDPATASASASEPGVHPNRPQGSIDFQKFPKLQEPYFVERTIDIHALVPGEKAPVLFRLEALRPAGKPGFDIAVYRQETVTVTSASGKAGETERQQLDIAVWRIAKLIHSDWPTAEQALEEVLGFLEMGCG